MSFWWCLTHKVVEGSKYDNDGCANMHRLGPYETEQQAADAPERTAARTARLDEEDEAEDDWGAKS